MKNEKEFIVKLLETFSTEASEHLETMSECLMTLESTDESAYPDAIESLFRSVHSLKGAARAVGNIEVESKCQDLESSVGESRKRSSPLSPADLDGFHKKVAEISAVLNISDPLEPDEQREEPVEESPTTSIESIRIRVDRLESIMSATEELLRVKKYCFRTVDQLESLENSSRNLGDIGDLNYHIQEVRDDVDKATRQVVSIIDTILREVRDVLVVPLGIFLKTYAVVGRNLARELGKEVDIIIDDGGLEIDKRVTNIIGDGFIHIFRNCIDHGIETPADRIAAGKKAKGSIQAIATRGLPGRIVISVSDDGAGIDMKTLRRRYGTRDGRNLSDDALLKSLFDAETTTRMEQSRISGLGMGLSVVKQSVESVGGNISLETHPGQGTSIIMDLPSRYIRYRGVLVQEKERLFFIPTSHIQRIFPLTDPAVGSMAQNLSVSMDNGVMDVAGLSDLLDLVNDKTEKRMAVGAILIIAAGEKRAAVLVDRVLHDEEIIVRSLGPHLQGLRSLIGAAVLADGAIVPVLNVHHLINQSGEAQSIRLNDTDVLDKGSSLPETSLADPVKVLIVEDSVTSRMLLRTILVAAGYKTSVAKDGVEALQILNDEPHDLVVSDVDMPRMNGFILTEKIRQHEQLAKIPIILVTTLDSDEDRRRGLRCGADAYLTKGGFDQTTLLHTMETLI